MCLVNIYTDTHTYICIFIRPLETIIRLIKNVYALKLPAFLPILTPSVSATQAQHHQQTSAFTHTLTLTHTHTLALRYSQDSQRQLRKALGKNEQQQQNQTTKRDTEKESERVLHSLALCCLSTLFHCLRRKYRSFFIYVFFALYFA